MKKIIFTGILSLSMVLGACELDEELSQVESESEETEVVEETSDKSRSEMTDEDKEEAKRKYEEEKAKEEQEAKQKAEEEAEKLRKENEAKEKAEQEATANEDAEELYLQIMEENLGMYVSVEFDEENKIFNLTPIDQDLIDAISMLPNGVGHEEWGVMVDSLASMSNTGTGLVGEGYTINLVNPLNHENILLWIIDGEIIYNVLDEL